MENLKQIAALAGYLGAAGGVVAGVMRILREYQKIREGMKCQLRSGMLHTYYKHRGGKQIRQYEAENFVLMYKAYKALRGNSFIDEIYEDVTSWEIIT